MSTSAKVDEVLQRIEEPIGEELIFVPEKIRRYGVTNLFHRALSYMFGWTSEGKPIKLIATAAGVLKTASTGAGLEDVIRNPTSAADGLISISSATVKVETFAAVQSVLDVLVKDYDVYVRFSKDGTAYSDYILLTAGVLYSWDLTVLEVSVKNETTDGTADASYQVVGYV